MAATHYTIEPWAYRETPSNDQHPHFPPYTPFTTNTYAPVNVDKELPPMPRPSLDSMGEVGEEQRVYPPREDEVHQRIRRSWLDDIENVGSDSEDLGECKLFQGWAAV